MLQQTPIYEHNKTGMRDLNYQDLKNYIFFCGFYYFFKGECFPVTFLTFHIQ